MSLYPPSPMEMSKYDVMLKILNVLAPAYAVMKNDPYTAGKCIEEFHNLAQIQNFFMGVQDPTKYVVDYLAYKFGFVGAPDWYRTLFAEHVPTEPAP